MNRQIYTPRGKKVLRKDGYILVYCPEYPFAKNGKYVFEHRLVMANHLGRPLRPDEHVHHINGNKQDNRLENLEILSNSEHHAEHWRTATPEERSRISKEGIAYQKAHKKKRNREFINCACGCGQQLEKLDSRGRVRKYVRGHNQRHKHWRHTKNDEP